MLLHHFTPLYRKCEELYFEGRLEDPRFIYMECVLENTAIARNGVLKED
jgi:hypothetical protein